MSVIQPIPSLVFIDSTVADYQQLLEGLVPGTEAILLDPQRNGIAQITEHLYQYPTSCTTPTQLVAIDAGLPDLEVLLADIEPDRTVVLIERHQDAIGVITTALNATKAHSLALVAHGSPGRVFLGRTGIDRDVIGSRAKEIKGWGVAAIDLYSCLSGVDQDFIQAFQSISGAAV